MSLHRRAARRDGNEPEIVEVFIRSGCSWLPMSRKGAPDGIVALGQAMALVEIKGYAGQLTDDQIAWHRAWKGPPPVICRSVDDALRVVKSLRLGFQV
jgi:hypothetical protein